MIIRVKIKPSTGFQRKVEFVFLSVILLMLIYAGFQFIAYAYETWVAQQMLVTIRRPKHLTRLITYLENPSEFILRCLSFLSLGAGLCTLGLPWFVGFTYRLKRLGKYFFEDPFNFNIESKWVFLPTGIFFGFTISIFVLLPVFY